MSETSYYELSNGLMLSDGILSGLESCGISEVEIAKIYGISRYYLWMLRRDYFNFRKIRANKSQMDDEERRKKKNLYMQEYRAKNREKFGYKKIRRNGRLQQKSRVIASVKLGRALEDDEVVHHIDGDLKNNDPDNLKVCDSQKDHMQFHLK